VGRDYWHAVIEIKKNTTGRKSEKPNLLAKSGVTNLMERRAVYHSTNNIDKKNRGMSGDRNRYLGEEESDVRTNAKGKRSKGRSIGASAKEALLRFPKSVKFLGLQK